MHLSERVELPAPAPAVASMLADPAAVAARIEAAGASGPEVAVVDAGEGAFTVTSRRRMATREIPAVFRTFVGSELEIRQVDAWEAPAADGSRHATTLVEITGTPVQFSGTSRITPVDAATTELVIEGRVTVGLPIAADAVAEAVTRALRSALTAEADAARAWLTR